MLRLTSLLALFVISTTLPAQPPRSPQDYGLSAYAHCTFSDNLKIVETAPLDQGLSARSVDTAHGPRTIDLLAGLRIMLAYPYTDFYANIKAEKLPTYNYPALKAALIENFDSLLASGETSRNTTLKPTLNRFDIRGMDRDTLQGGVLGIYLLFDDPAHTVTTIYLLNQEPFARKFQTIQQYRQLRDQFLSTYTACVRSNQHTTP